jgi:hypothetical protein
VGDVADFESGTSKPAVFHLVSFSAFKGRPTRDGSLSEIILIAGR